MSESSLAPNENTKPDLDEKTAKKLIEYLYGLRVKKITRLDGYDDKNFHAICERDFDNTHIQKVDNDGYTFKVTNSLHSEKTDLIQAQIDMLLYLNQQGIECPVPVKQKTGSYFSLEVLHKESVGVEKMDTDKRHAVRLLVFKSGVLLNKVPLTEKLLVNIGYFTVKLDQCLAGFSHPAYEEYSILWSLQEIPKLRQFVHAVESKGDQDLIKCVIKEFEDKVISVLDRLEKGIIHGDINEQNVIVEPTGNFVNAIIDFGDTHKSCLIFELAIVMCYMMIQAGDLQVGRFVLNGYQKGRILPDTEKNILKLCICARLCQSLTMGAYSYKLDPGNEYLLTTQKSGWKMLRELWPVSDEELCHMWKL